MADDNVESRLKKELVTRGVQLWKPPYYGVRGGGAAALQALAETWDDTAASRLLPIFQSRALTKLRQKGKLLDELRVRVLGAPERHNVRETVVLPETWAEDTQLTTRDAAGDSRSYSLILQRVNPDLTISEFSNQLMAALHLTDHAIRLVCRGKTLPTSQDGVRLTERLSGTAHLLCLVQPTSSSSSQDASVRNHAVTDEELIANIRQAARTLQAGAMLDITDAAGNLVSMTHADRLAFLTALGLHAMGRQRLEDDAHSSESALLFLIQADVEWEHLHESWRHRVDNYGLLQLDIAWVYLGVACLENLPDAIQRLDKAETVLRKQVHTNFVTLALVQADLDKPVPPVAGIFVRLFLLQGVVHHLRGNVMQSRERLDWAWALCKSLRAVSPTDVVARLVEAMDVLPFQAISALRRSNGNVDQAAALIEEDLEKEDKVSEARYKQRKIGLCENGIDHVDLHLLDQLKGILRPGDGEDVASGLLRLSNNKMERALDLYQGGDISEVFRRVAELDRVQGVVKRKRSRITVDEVALATLVSMGVADDGASRALEANNNNNNNVDGALLWLTNRPSAVVESAAPPPAVVPNNDAAATESATASTAVPPVVSSPPPTANLAVPVVTPRRNPEKEAVALLEQVLGKVLEQQNSSDWCLGAFLDEEWAYIQQYRQQNARSPAAPSAGAG
jgi:hypothetical protein